MKSDLRNIKIKNKEICQILQYRSKLLSNNTAITYKELGAGSHKLIAKEKKVKNIAKYSGSDERKGIFLYKMVKHFKPDIIIELGTSLGLGTFYMACADRNCPVITIEGNESVLDIAKNESKFQEFTNIQFILSNFDDILEIILMQNKNKKAFVFIDGNHNYTSTLKYFKLCLKHNIDESVIIIDDIHWSKDMDRAWKEIITFNRIKYSIDYFYSGLLHIGAKNKNNYIASF